MMLKNRFYFHYHLNWALTYESSDTVASSHITDLLVNKLSGGQSYW